MLASATGRTSSSVTGLAAAAPAGAARRGGGGGLAAAGGGEPAGAGGCRRRRRGTLRARRKEGGGSFGRSLGRGGRRLGQEAEGGGHVGSGDHQLLALHLGAAHLDVGHVDDARQLGERVEEDADLVIVAGDR